MPPASDQSTADTSLAARESGGWRGGEGHDRDEDTDLTSETRPDVEGRQ